MRAADGGPARKCRERDRFPGGGRARANRLRRSRARRTALHKVNNRGLVRLRWRKVEGFTCGPDGRQQSEGENCGALQGVGQQDSPAQGRTWKDAGQDRRGLRPLRDPESPGKAFMGC